MKMPVPLTAHSPVMGGHDLFRGVLTDAQTPLPLSAAGQPATRLAACSDGSFAFSTGADVFRLSCSPTRKRRRPIDQGSHHKDAESAEGAAAEGNVTTSAVSSAIADDYIVPKPFSGLLVDRIVPHCIHQTEVQSVEADTTRLASVDSYGRCVVTVGNEPTSRPTSARGEGDHQYEGKIDSFVLSPVSLSSGDPGWAGLALKKNDPGTTVVARQFFRDVTVFDRDVPVRTIYTILPPTSVQCCGDRNMIAVAEGHGVAFYDLRVGERSACIDRKAPGSGQILSLDASSDGGLLAAAGMDRTLHVFDLRTMRVRDRWPGCLKYECAATILSREMEGMAYVCSVDNEVACGAWSSTMADYLKANVAVTNSLMISGANTKSPRRAYGFRADVRLTGMTRRNLEGEEVAVMSEAGAFYLLRRSRE